MRLHSLYALIPTYPERVPALFLIFFLLLSSYAQVFAQATSTHLTTGTLPRSWTTGGGTCTPTTPAWSTYEYNPTFFILRQSGCSHWEKPFVYVILGSEKALLLDTGAGKPGLLSFIEPLLSKGGVSEARELIVVHSHGHGDHTAGDSEFQNKPRMTLVPPVVADLKTALGISNWPDDIGSIDLGGGRILEALPIPGHDPVSIALYDRATGILLTGDTVYPGRLYVNVWDDFARSIAKLVDFTRTRPVTHVLGTHIEQSRTPFEDYPVRTAYQENEHDLALSRANLLELNEALQTAKTKTESIPLRDITVVPRPPRAQRPKP